MLKLQPSDCDQYALYQKAFGKYLSGSDIVPVEGYGANPLILQWKQRCRKGFCGFIIASSQQQTQVVQNRAKERKNPLVTLHITFRDPARFLSSLSVPDSTFLYAVLDVYLKVKSMETSHA